MFSDVMCAVIGRVQAIVRERLGEFQNYQRVRVSYKNHDWLTINEDSIDRWLGWVLKMDFEEALGSPIITLEIVL